MWIEIFYAKPILGYEIQSNDGGIAYTLTDI